MGSIVTCVTCEQVLTGGRCTNELCPGYAPLQEEDHVSEKDMGAPVATYYGGLPEEENLVCSECSTEFIAGWVEDGDGDDECPGCDHGRVITKAEKKRRRTR